MAEETKNPEVELDTDGVNEETINVEAPEVSDESFEKKQDVDLGYVDVSQSGKSAKELLQETKEEEPKKEVKEEIKVEQTEDDSGLQDYSDKVQKRIKKLTFQVREAERREKAAIEYAKGLKTKYDSAEQKYDEVDTNYLKEYDARIDAERDKAKSALKAAFDSQDPEQITEAQDKLTKLAVEKEKVSMTLGEKEAKKKEAESKPQEVTPEQPQISARAQEWASDNEWFGSDRVMTSAAMGIHDELIQQGIDAETNEYYNQINKRMKEYFPQKFADATEEKPGVTKEPVQNVASVSRRAGGRKSVKLTKSQVVIAKKLGVPLEEYAKYVKEGA
jgi:hypothetical protein